jgi:hypothetical protein
MSALGRRKQDVMKYMLWQQHSWQQYLRMMANSETQQVIEYRQKLAVQSQMLQAVMVSISMDKVPTDKAIRIWWVWVRRMAFANVIWGNDWDSARAYRTKHREKRDLELRKVQDAKYR